MDKTTKAPECYPGFYAGFSWFVLLLLVLAGAGYAAAAENSSDFREVAEWIPSPYPTLVGWGILVLISALYAGSVQRTMNALAACLPEDAGKRVCRHAGLFLFGILGKVLAFLGGGALLVAAWFLYDNGYVPDAVAWICAVAGVLLGMMLYAWGSLMTAQSWNGGAADLLACAGGGRPGSFPGEEAGRISPSAEARSGEAGEPSEGQGAND